MAKNQHEPTHFTLSTLKERGWTDGLIAALLGEPDLRKKNPHYRSAAPTKLFERGRVLEHEASEQFKAKQTGRKDRSTASLKAADTRREALLSAINELQIRVEVLPPETLLKNAIRARDDWRFERKGDWKFDGDSADPETQARWMVNFVRHELTFYDHAIAGLFGQVGRDAGYSLLKSKILDAIAEAYPALAKECERQKLGGEGKVEYYVADY